MRRHFMAAYSTRVESGGRISLSYLNGNYQNAKTSLNWWELGLESEMKYRDYQID